MFTKLTAIKITGPLRLTATLPQRAAPEFFPKTMTRLSGRLIKIPGLGISNSAEAAAKRRVEKPTFHLYCCPDMAKRKIILVISL